MRSSAKLWRWTLRNGSWVMWQMYCTNYHGQSSIWHWAFVMNEWVIPVDGLNPFQWTLQPILTSFLCKKRSLTDRVCQELRDCPSGSGLYKTSDLFQLSVLSFLWVGYLRKSNWDLHLIGNGNQPDWLSGLRQGDGFTPPIIRAHARQRTKHGSRQNWFGPILNCSNNVPSNHHLCPFRHATYSIVLTNWVSAAESIIYVHAVPSLPGFIRQRIWK